MTGATGNRFYLGIVRAAADGSGVTVTPMHGDTGPIFTASTAENVIVPVALRRLLDRAGIAPPAPGKLLDKAAVETKLAELPLSSDDRFAVKHALGEMKMLGLGDRHPVQE